MKRHLVTLTALAASVMVLAGCGQGTTTQPPIAPAVTQPEVAAPTTGAVATPAIAAGSPVAQAAAQTAAEAFVDGGPRFVAAKAVAEAADKGTDILFVDARPATDYEFGHIPGAVNVPYFEPEKHLDKLPKDKWIVTYCECPHAEAGQVADALEKNGYTKVRVIDEGLQGWKDLGRSVVGGTQPNG
jgi:rhodanese-related sulfurtransferase